MSGTITGKTYSKTHFLNFFGRPYLWVIFIFSLFFSSWGVVGQNGVNITSIPPQNPTNINPVSVKFKFDRPINGFDLEDVNYTGGVLDKFYVGTPNFKFEKNLGRLSDFTMLNVFNIDPEATKEATLAIDFSSSGDIYALTLGKGVFTYSYTTNGNITDRRPIIQWSEFSEPRDLAVGNGKVYIADSGNNRIVVFDIISSTISYFGVGNLSSPSGLAIGGNGKIYVADTGNDRIAIFDPVSGIQDPPITGSNTQALNSPIRLAVDGKYNLYVNDIGNNRIQIFNSSGAYTGTIEGNNENLMTAGSIEVDEYGFIYIADIGNIDLETFLDFENITTGDLLSLIGNTTRVQVFRANDLSIIPETINEELNNPIDLAIKPCGFLAINNSDASLIGFSTVKVIFDLKIYNILPDTFTADLTIAEECEIAKINVPINVGFSAKCEDEPSEASNYLELVWDQTKPVINCPTSIVTISKNSAGKYILPDYRYLADDNCDTNLKITQDPLPGEITTNKTVTITAKDAAGNISTTCSFKVELELDQEPSLTCPEDGEIPPLILDENCDYNNQDFTSLITIQNSPNGELIQTITRLNKILTVKNELKEDGVIVDDCTFFVNLLDNTAPIIVCPATTQILSKNEEGKYIIPDYAGLVTDKCDSNPLIKQVPESGKEVFVDTQITLTAKDDSGNESEICEFNLELQVTPPTNEGPIANDDFYSIEQDGILNINAADGVLKNDVDETPEALTVVEVVTNVTNGILIWASDGSFTYTPNTGTVGIDEFTYLANDGELDSNIAKVYIDITSTDFPNFRPNALDDFYDTPFETTLNIPVPGILGNDTDDDDNDILTADIKSDPINGDLNWSPDGSFTYVPNLGFSGEDSFTYLANDGKEDSNIATVTINVGNFNALEISCPLNQTAQLVLNCQFVLPDYTTLAGLSDEDAVVTQDPLPGEIADYGTIITLTATLDGESVSCTFQPELEGDTTPPVASCVSTYEITLTQNGTENITPNEINSTSSDNCGEVIMTLDKSDFTTANLGENTVILTVSDGSGNTDNCETIVTVLPYEDPNGDFECRTQMLLQLDTAGAATLNISDLYTGDPGDREFTLSTSSFDCTNIGDNSVVMNYIGNDGSGNCGINVIVEDRISPVVQTRNINVTLDSLGTSTITPEMIDNGSTDNCGTPQLSLDVSTFSCDDLGENVVILTATDASGNAVSLSAIVTVTGSCLETPETDFPYIFIYPNPTPGPFTFDTPNGWSIEKVEVFDARGRYVLTEAYSENQVEYSMNLSSLQQAVYILKLYTSQGIKILRVIIY